MNNLPNLKEVFSLDEEQLVRLKRKEMDLEWKRDDLITQKREIVNLQYEWEDYLGKANMAISEIREHFLSTNQLETFF